MRVDDARGNLIADKLFFDIKKQTLNIDSFNDGKINANININMNFNIENYYVTGNNISNEWLCGVATKRKLSRIWSLQHLIES